MKKLCVTLLFALLLAALLVLPVHADEEVLPLEISPSSRLLTDGREGAPATVSSPLEIKSEEGMSALYLIFYDTPVLIIPQIRQVLHYLQFWQDKVSKVLHQHL